MKKTYLLSLITIAILFFSTMTAISSDASTILETWRNPQTGHEVFVNPYNHDNSVYRGPEYQSKISELIANGYVHKNAAIIEISGGSGPQFGSYEEDYFVKSMLTSTGFGDEWLLWRSIPNGLEYSTDEGNTWIPWDGTGTIELPTELEDIDIDALFEHDMSMYVWVGPKIYNWGWRWIDMGDSPPTSTMQIMNSDGTESTWIFYDDWVAAVDLIHSEVTVNGEEEWGTRTVIYELPQGSPDGSQLRPLHYGVPLLGTLYGPQSLDEILPELMEFAKEINGQWYTYTDSPLDLWIYNNIYKPNHAKSFIRD